jgi:predicted MFS family arabinose efflux permease
MRTGLLFAGSTLLVAVVLLFSGILNMGSFRKSYVESLVGSYTVAGAEARNRIEYALRYGKDLANFANIQDILAGIKEDSPAIEAVAIILPDGRVAYDLDGPAQDRRLPDALKSVADFRSGKVASTWQLFQGKYHAFIPIRDHNQGWAGTIELQFDPLAVDQRTGGFLRRTMGIMLAVGLGAVVLLGMLLPLVRVVDPRGRIRKRRCSAVLLGVLSAAQITYGAVNIAMFRRAYPPVVQENALLTGGIIRNTVEDMVRKGVAYRDMVGIEDWFGRINRAVPEIERIELEAPGLAGPGLALPMRADRTGARFTLRLRMSEAYAAGKVRALVLDAVTMLVTSFFFMVEMVVFLGLALERMAGAPSRPENGSPAEPEGNLAEPEANLVRPLAFLLLVSGYLSVSFIPVLMRDLYQPLLGLAPAVVVGLPISAEMFGAFASSLCVGHAIDRRGWRPAFLAGLVLFGAGSVLSGAATSAVPFILARGLVGVGYGAAWMGLRGQVAAGATGASRNQGFSVLNAGIYAGQSCGAVLGAMLAERMGFPGVFYLAAGLVPVTAAFALALMDNARPASASATGAGQARAFFADRRLLAFLLLITLPTAVCGMFLNYFLPVYARSAGVSQGDIGRTFLAYGVCIVYAGPFLARHLGNRLSPLWVMFLASQVGVLALAVFCVRASFAGAVAAVVLLGVADSTGLVAQNSYFVNLPAALVYGRGKALSIFSAVKKVGQMLGPNVFGLAAAAGPVVGVGLVAGACLTATGAFWISNKPGPVGQAQHDAKG